MEDVTSWKKLREFLKADLKANENRKRTCAYKYLKWLRISRFFYLNNYRMLGVFARKMKNHYGNKYGFDFNYRVPIGKGLTIAHNSGVVFFPKSAGENLILRNFVVVGNQFSGGECPSIGNNVAFGAGCKVLGSIKIGNHVVIGANAVVTHDIPDNSVVAGIPAKVIRKTKDRWGTPFEE